MRKIYYAMVLVNCLMLTVLVKPGNSEEFTILDSGFKDWEGMRWMKKRGDNTHVLSRTFRFVIDSSAESDSPGLKYWATLENGNIRAQKRSQPGKPGEPPSSMLGIGLMPGYGWYRQGFINITVNGKVVPRTLPEARVNSPEGSVILVYPGPPKVELDFMHDQVQKHGVMMRVRVPDESDGRIELRLICHPGHYKKPEMARFTKSIGGLVVKASNEEHKIPVQDNRLFYFDARYHLINGSCGLEWKSEEMDAVKVRGIYPISTILQAKSNQREIHIRLWQFSGKISNEEAYEAATEYK